MANNKKFIVKNGLLTQENVVIGSTTDNGVDNLQVTGSSSFAGTLTATSSVAGIATVSFTNDSGPSSLIAEFKGDANSLDVTNFTAGDYSITNSGNGIRFYNNTDGLEIVYNNNVDIEFNSSGIDFKREPTYNGDVFWNAGNDGAGSGLDADLLDGLDSLQFLRSDQDDTMNGSLTITGDLTVSGNTTYINTEEILLADNIITLNADFNSGTPTEDTGIEVQRGSEAKSSIIWDETNDYWRLDSAGTNLGRIITTDDEARNGGTLDADTLDQLDSTQFLRSDESDTTSGNLTVQGDLTVGNNAGTAFIRMDGAGVNGTIASSGGEIGFLNTAFNYAIKVKTNGDIEVRDDIYAQNWFDLNDPTYYMDLDGTSILNNISIDDKITHNGDADTYLNFNAADSFEIRTGGTQQFVINNTYADFNNEVRAPKFVDSDNNNYYMDPFGTSILQHIGVDRFIVHNGDIDTYIDFADSEDVIDFYAGGTKALSLNTTADFSVDVYGPKFVDSDDNNFYVDPNSTSVLYGLNVYSGVANTAVNIGTDVNERFEFLTTPTQGYIRYHQDDTNATDNSVNFEIVSSGFGLNRFNFNSNINAGSNSISAAFGLFSTAAYAEVFKDYTDETYYADFANTDVSIRIAGEILAGNGSASTPTYSFADDTDTGMFAGATNRLDFSAGGNVELQVTSTYAYAPGEFRAPLFRDSVATGYYGDFGGTSVMSQIDLDDYIRHNGNTNTYFGFPSNGNFRVVTAGSQKLNIDTDSADFAVNTFAPAFYTDDYLVHTGDTDTFLGFSAADNFVLSTGGTTRLSVNNTSATFTNDTTAPNFYASKFYDSDNNSYYVDPSDASVLMAVGIDSELFHNGDTDTKLSFETDSISLAAAGTVQLTANTTGVHASDIYASNFYGTTQASAPIFYDSDDVNYYADFANAGISIVTKGQVIVGNTTGSGFLTVDKPTAVGPNPFAAGNIMLTIGDAGTVDYSVRTDSFGNIYNVIENGGNIVWYDSGASGKFAILNDGSVAVNNDSITYATTDGTPNFVSALSGNKFNVSGGAHLTGKTDAYSIYAAEGANTAINEATFLGVNELGFSAGGGFYMDETTRVKVRGNKDIFTTGNYYGGRYYDGNDENYYLDPASTSIANRIDLDDYIRHNGDTNTYFGFNADDTFGIWTGGTNKLSANTTVVSVSVDLQAPRLVDSDNDNYFVDPSGDSVMNTIDIDDYIRHRGDTNTYIGFDGNDRFRVWTNNIQRLNIDNNSADFSVNVYAPRYYDSDDNLYYVDPAGTSRMNTTTFGIPGNGANTKGRFLSIEGGTDASGEGSGRIFFAEHNSTTASMDRFGMSIVYQGGDNGVTSATGQPVTFSGTSNGTWALIGHDDSVNGVWAMRGPRDASYVEARAEFRAPLFRDSISTSFYLDPGSTSILNTVRANLFQIDGSTYTIDSPSGEYGSIKVSGDTNGWAGYAINDDWVFMSNGAANAGIYNDTDNEWSVYLTQNGASELRGNGVHQISAQNGYGYAPNQMRSPVYYGTTQTTYYVDLDNNNTSNQLRIGGQYQRLNFNTSGDGKDNVIINAQDENHWIWQTAGDWGMFWATNSSSAYRDSRWGDNTISFVGNDNLRALIDLDTGDFLSNGEIYAGNYNLSAGNESIPLNPAYGAGTSEQKLFDGNLYWEKRAIQALRGNEDSATGTTGEYVKSGDSPGSSSYVLRTSGYRTFYSDYIEVEPGEEIYGEMWVKYISGSGGLLYYGVERLDKNKQPIAPNNGVTYFVAQANNVTSTSWRKYQGYTIIPSSHTPYNGSDGLGVRYVRIIVLMNSNAGGALREFTAPILMRSNIQSNIRTDQGIYASRFYDTDDQNFYLDPASTSILNTVDASIFRDREATQYYLDPATTGRSINVRGEIQNPSIWINDGDNNNNYNENIRLFDAPNGVSVIAFSASGTGGLPTTSILGYSDRFETRYQSNWQSRVYSNRTEFANAVRAPIFADINDPQYWVNPASNTTAANLRGAIKINSDNNQIWLDMESASNGYGRIRMGAWAGDPFIEFSDASNGAGQDQVWAIGADDRDTGSLVIRWGGSTLFPADWTGHGTERFQLKHNGNLSLSGGEPDTYRLHVGGTGFATSDWRAPRFYDSDDPTYYGDFASTSVTNVMQANRFQTPDGWDIYSDDANTLSIRSNDPDNGEIIFRDSNSYATGRIYFDDDNHWGFRTGQENEWSIYMERNGRTILYYNGGQEARTQNGYFEANNELRTKIFRDSDDPSNYYVDPNGTSRLRDLTMVNPIVGPGINGYSDSLVRRDNRIISPSEDPSGRLKFGFTSWNNNNSSPYADYLHLRSYTDSSGGSDNLVSFLKSGFGMRIWQQSWNSTTAYSNYRNVSLYNENPGGGNSLYANIFYDADDPTYRVDPTDISRIKHLEVGAVTNTADYYNAAIEVREFNYGGAQSDTYSIAPRIGFHWGGRVASQIALASSGEIRILNNPGNATENFRARNINADESFYGQRFYDSNSPTYYGDFASTSVFNSIDNRGEINNDGWFRSDVSGRGLYSTPNAMHWYSDSNRRWRLYSTQSTAEILFTTAGNNARGYVYADNGNNIGFLNQSGSWALRTNGSTTEIYGSLYADIMYDRNSPTYYVNPAGQSHMNTLTLAGNRIGFINSSFDAEIRVSDSNPDGTGATFEFWGDTGQFNAEVTAEVFRATRHMRAGRYYDYNDGNFYTDPASTSLMNIVQADIYYDRNNTAYKFNGASDNDTRFRGVQAETMAFMGLSGQTQSSKEYYAARPRITSDQTYWTGSMGWGRQDMNSTVANWGSGFIDTWGDPPGEPSGTSHWVGIQAYHRLSGNNRYGWQMVGGPIGNLRFRNSWSGWNSWKTVAMHDVNDGSGGSLYAGAFRDADSTGYYIDPSSSGTAGNFNGSIYANEVYARNWFRNQNSNEGIYNQSTGVHAYSRSSQYYVVAGNNNGSSMSLQLRATYEGNIRKWLYGDSSYAGFLNTGGQWHLRYRQGDGYSPNLWFVESGNESWTGNPGNDIGKIEYHSNRFYIVAGGNSNRIVQFRQNGSDRSYVDNNGLYVGTATSARWADVAERYSADREYEPGQVLGINLDGDSEVTLYQPGMPLAGAVSTKPGVRMNDMGIENDKSKKAKMNPFIALKGRIPVHVNGDVKKGQWVIADKDGKGRGVDYGTPGINTFDIIGIALGDSENGEVEVKV